MVWLLGLVLGGVSGDGVSDCGGTDDIPYHDMDDIPLSWHGWMAFPPCFLSQMTSSPQDKT